VARVLISEDESDIRDAVRYKLESAGFNVTAVEDGAAALSQALTDPPDLVLLDVMTPGLTGLAVATALRRAPATAQIPILMLTAETDDSDVQAGYQAGANGYMMKPFSPRDLLSRVRSMLPAGAA
jgi:DNA-binding response OmpR family regulator